MASASLITKENENRASKRQQILSKIEFLVVDLVRQLCASPPPPRISLRASSDDAEKQVHVISRSDKRLAYIMQCLARIFQLVTNDQMSTKRDVFYDNKKLYGSQGNLDRAITAICELLNEPRVNLNIVECFFLPIVKPSYKSLELNYRVVKGSGGNRDITVTLRDPRAVEVISDQRINYHSHRVIIGDSEGSRGDYTICLDNSYSYDTKVVALAIYLLDEKGDYVGEQAALSPNNALSIEIEVFEASTRRVKANLNRAENEMNVLRTTSLADRTIAEQNFEKVNWYGTLNTCVMVISAITQVYVIRSLLTEGSSLGKFLRKGQL